MANKFEIIRKTDKNSAAAEAGEYLNKLLTDSKNRAVLLMLSGGSALPVLEFVGQTALSSNLIISMMDERFSQDPAINNFAQLQKTDFYQLALNAECHFFGTLPRNGETMVELAERWEANLRKWRAKNPQGLIIATLGMGADGHTAGIFPSDDKNKFEELYNAETWIVTHEAGTIHPQRLTPTLNFFKMIDFGLGFVCGAEKKPKLNNVIEKEGKPHQLPALAWYEIKQVKIFTDIA